jgi:sterol desaturase/sphingolipid hydroxylase (fatty acid hydroxylase superfamily)
MKTSKSIRLFENPLLEKTTHVHPIIPLLIWGPVATYCFYRAAADQSLTNSVYTGLFISGLISWTLLEYVTHRFFFHMECTTDFQRRIQFIAHGIHHEDPQDPTRLVMPPVAGLILATVFFSLFRFLLGPVYVVPFFGAFLVGYLCYDYTHFWIHHFTARTRFGKWVKYHHMKHHYTHPDARWGVSSPLWDYIFGTMRPKADQAPSVNAAAAMSTAGTQYDSAKDG